MMTRTAIILVLALSVRAVFAMDWPVAPPHVAATFGTFAKGRIVAGVVLAASDGSVRSSDDGEVSFLLEDGTHPAGLPTPLGSFLVVEHQKGLAAVYSHLAPGSLPSYLRKPKAGDILGRPGNSGWIEGPGLVFQVFDRRADSWVNPLLVLPPLAEDKAPIIRSLALSRDDKTYALSGAVTIPQGTYRISVDVASPSDAPWTVGPLAPYVILLSIDGAQTTEDVFDVARASKGRLSFFARSPVASSELRTQEGRYMLAERLFTRGHSTIMVKVEDAVGNSHAASWPVIVE
jgi:hypothetical protein